MLRNGAHIDGTLGRNGRDLDGVRRAAKVELNIISCEKFECVSDRGVGAGTRRVLNSAKWNQVSLVDCRGLGFY